MSSKGIYDDLPEFDIGSNVEKLTNENEILHQKILQLEEEVGNLSKAIINLKKIQQNLATNISELFKTALNEINRKNQIISDLHKKYDELLFKRQNNDNNSTRRTENHYKKRSRSPSIDNRSLKRFNHEHNHTKNYNRHQYRISPKKRNDDKSYHRYKTKERSSSRELPRDSHTRKDKQIHQNEVKKKHEKTEILSKTEQHEKISNNNNNNNNSNNTKENLENRKLNDDNFLKTANSKGNIYKKELFQYQNHIVNNKHNDKRKIDIVTKKLFDKAEQAIGKTKSLVESEKDEQKSKRRTIDDEKLLKVTNSKNNQPNDEVKDQTNSVIKTIKPVADKQTIEETKITGKIEQSVKENLHKEINAKTTENQKLDNVANKSNNNDEKTKHKKEKESDKKPDRESNHEKINKKSRDQRIKTKNNPNQKIENKNERKPDKKPPIKDKISNKTAVEVINTTSNKPHVEKQSDKTDNQTIENEDENKIDEKTVNDLSLQKKINHSEIVDKKNNKESVEQEITTQDMYTKESPSKERTTLENTNELTIKECVVQLTSDDILNIDDNKPIEHKTPTKSTNDNELKNTIGRILRSAKKKIHYNEILNEPLIKPTIVKTIKTKRGRPRKNSLITSNVEITNDDIPVLHITENSTKCNNLIELANIELSPSKDRTIVSSTQHQQIDENPDTSSLHLGLSISTSDDSLDSNRNVLKPKRRRCIIKMID